MLYYDRINISEGTDINKTSTLKVCDIFHYWYFLDKEFMFELFVCNGCHDVLMSNNLSNIAILDGAHYLCIINGISKSDTVNLLENGDFTEREEYHKNKKNIKKLLPYIKWLKK